MVGEVVLGEEVVVFVRYLYFDVVFCDLWLGMGLDGV